MDQELVLIYHMNDEKKERLMEALKQLGIQQKEVKPEMYDEPIGKLAGVTAGGSGQKLEKKLPFGRTISEEMIVMCGLNRDRMDALLAEMKKQRISVGLKAVITMYNYKWSSYDLFEELRKEHLAMTSGKNS